MMAWKKSGINIKALNKYKHKGKISVGIHEDAPDYPDAKGTSLPWIANLLEFGTKNVPEYRWLEKSITADTKQYTTLIVSALKHAKTNKRQFDISMDEIGRKAVLNVQNHLEANDIGLPDNAQATQNAKGGNSPLINTRHLVQNIDFKKEK